MRIIVRFRPRGVEFRNPLDPAPRTAVLASNFLESRSVRFFPNGWTDAAARFQPGAVAGPMDALRAMARFGVELKHAVIVFTNLEARLTESDRDFLWDTFGVPVFEQCLGAGNELIAAECEAHEGVHLYGALPAEAIHQIEHAVCACGDKHPRLVERRVGVAALA